MTDDDRGDQPVHPLATSHWWRARVLGPDGVAVRLVVVGSFRHGDAEVVDLDEQEAAAEIGDAAVITAGLSPTGDVTSLLLAPELLPKAPPLWFVEVPDDEDDVPATHLVAFTGFDQPEGAFLDEDAYAATGVPEAAQVGVIRWYPSTGRVHPTYVQPAWRRRGVYSALVFAATALSAARGWARLYGDGNRTAMGEQVATRVSWARFHEPLTQVSPPMTPGDD